ncbi:MAG: hypothetical protein H0U18_05125 [Pyrinomonadaceae bacterium]|nr:hypothetical protein [Pyrinomonadaceae bacterium]
MKRILEPQSVFFGITLIYFLSTLIIVLGQKDNAFIVDQWGFFRRSMTYPLLLLLGCVLILIGRFATLGLAMTIAAGVIYAIGYRGLVGVSNTHDAVGISDILRIWFDVMPANLIVQTGLAAVMLALGTVQLSRLLRKRRKLPS